jgi:D-glycero-D-manno-heptose 1,7-bisphosphate phosphatase
MIKKVHDHMLSELESHGARLDAVYYCAHHPSVGEPPYRLQCDCRKPQPGLILRAAKEFEIDLERSWMVGDRYSDIELAHNAGVKAAFVLTGYGRGEWENQRVNWKQQPDLIEDNLLRMVKSLIDGATTGSSKER